MKNLPENFLSCDWGTSSFRLRLVAVATLAVIAEETSNTGIAIIFKEWQQKQEDRGSFYLSFIRQHIASLEQKANRSLLHVPLLVSGMASSSIGMIEVDYKQAPFQVNGSDLKVKMLSASPVFPHPVYVISGVKTDSDVMRGEETQVVGCIAAGNDEANEQIVVLPGTHSKHVVVKGRQVISFQTYMTGEFFDLLAKQSILSRSVKSRDDFQEDQNRQSFEKGLIASGHSSLLHSAFLVRTNELFGKMSKQQNYYYLSGMLIGNELRELLQKNDTSITVVGNEKIIPLYADAFRFLLPGKTIKTMNETEATIRGQFEIYSRLKEKE